LTQNVTLIPTMDVSNLRGRGGRVCVREGRVLVRGGEQGGRG